METYAIVSAANADGKATVRRASDGKVARCKLSWLETVTDGVFQARSKTKAIRLDGLDWTKEG